MRDKGSKKIPDPEIILRPVLETGRGFYLTVGILVAVILWGAYAYVYQLIYGLSVTGLNRPVFWGFYIANFVFFIGISHAGTLISAILRVTQTQWRRPITRAAEAITVFALFCGAVNPLVDLGRPDRVLNILHYGRIQSPIIWDIICISTYITGSILYLYLPMIPDLALLRDRVKKRQWLYKILALGWRGTERQKRFLGMGIGIMAVVIIPIAVSVHTVVSWIFAMTLQPMWHSTIFGPYFVVGAIFSGIASIIIAMGILRWAFHLEDFLKPIHFNNLGILLLVFTCLWFYFTFAEYLTTFYGDEPEHMAVFYSKVSGEFSLYFWLMFLLCFAIPFLILAFPKTRTIWGTVIASISINIGMWLERFTIVIPTLTRPRLPYERGIYHPSWVEWSELAALFAGFTLLYVIFSKFFPVISIWEVTEGMEKEESVPIKLSMEPSIRYLN